MSEELVIVSRRSKVRSRCCRWCALCRFPIWPRELHIRRNTAQGYWRAHLYRCPLDPILPGEPRWLTMANDLAGLAAAVIIALLGLMMLYHYFG